MPERIQRLRISTPPQDAVFVGHGSQWWAPLSEHTQQIRMPGIGGSGWEEEGRLHKKSGEQHAYVRYIDGEQVTTQHLVLDATPEQVVAIYREKVGLNPRYRVQENYRPIPGFIEHVKSELAGKNLSCWCPLDQPCHADVLLEIANS